MAEIAMRVFVIMPFHEDFDPVYQDLIKSPLEAAGYTVSRADDPGDDDFVHENIYDQIVQNLWDADYIIADLSGLKPNVVYELGIAHTLNKRTILISQELDASVPFDLKSQYVLKYQLGRTTASDLSRQLLDILKRSERGNYRFSNIVEQFARNTGRTIMTDPPTNVGRSQK